MSWIWNILLSLDNEEFWEDGEQEPCETCEPLERINAWIDAGRLVILTSPTFEEGAGSGMDANLYGGGFKHFDIEEFIEVVKSQNWKARSNVQLWVRGNEEGMAGMPFHQVELGGQPHSASGRGEAAGGMRRRGRLKKRRT